MWITDRHYELILRIKITIFFIAATKKKREKTIALESEINKKIKRLTLNWSLHNEPMEQRREKMPQSEGTELGIQIWRGFFFFFLRREHCCESEKINRFFIGTKMKRLNFCFLQKQKQTSVSWIERQSNDSSIFYRFLLLVAGIISFSTMYNSSEVEF